MIAWAALALAPGFVEFTLNDLDGHPRSIRAADAKATAVVFLSTVCPISQEYERRLSALHETFAPLGVQFVFVYSNRNETPAGIRRYASEGRFAFPVYRDERQRVADLLGAAVTPTAAVISPSGELVYRGRVDDSVNPARVKDRTLENALRAALAAKPVKIPETKAFG